jgi:hypothetical protein
MEQVLLKFKSLGNSEPNCHRHSRNVFFHEEQSYVPKVVFDSELVVAWFIVLYFANPSDCENCRAGACNKNATVTRATIIHPSSGKFRGSSSR